MLMTYEEIATMIGKIADSIGCDYHYYDESEKDVVKTPYLLFDYPDRGDFKADDLNYAKIQRLNIEYDSAQKDFKAEGIIEDILDEFELAYTKEDTRYEGHDAYGVMYTTEVVINGN